MSSYETLFDNAMSKYQECEDPNDVINDFHEITQFAPHNFAGWTCLAWLQLLCDSPSDALQSARIAVKLNPKDPQARVNLSLALLDTKSKGVRDHIDFVKRILFTAPAFQEELRKSILDGLKRKPNWESLQKVKNWLEL